MKKVIGANNPGITKDQLYDKMLEPYNYEKRIEADRKTLKHKIVYYCRYRECGKRYTKTWNLLDHVRMHEGIRPFKCEKCPKSFTQKGNLKKHQIQHTLSTLKERKRFKCNQCGKGYTENYNLEVSYISFFILSFQCKNISFLSKIYNYFYEFLDFNDITQDFSDIYFLSQLF